MTIEQLLSETTLVNTPKQHFKNFNEARKWAKINIVGIYKNLHTNENIYISRTAIDKYLSNKAVSKSMSIDAHLSALIILPKLIEVSVLKETHCDERKKKSIVEIQRFYGAINFNNRIYPVKITVKVYIEQTNKAYSYEVMKIESPIIQ